MSNFNVGDKIVAEEIKALKASVKAEMLRRSRAGSLASYGGTAYDFTASPAVGVRIDKEHYTKIREPIGKINTADLPPENPPNMPSLTVIDGKLAVYKADTGKSSTTHHCMSSCSGLCYNTCSENCSGCSGCSGCGSGCANGCLGCTSCSGCTASCAFGCSGCSGGCTSCTNCSSSCTGSCTACTSCTGTCSACGGGCSSACSNSCSGCSGGCTGGFML